MSNEIDCAMVSRNKNLWRCAGCDVPLMPVWEPQALTFATTFAAASLGVEALTQCG